MSLTAEKKRAALLQAALELFAEKGFNGCSTALIAKRAGVASGTLFFHFNTKEALIHALFSEVKSKVGRRVLATFSEDMPLRERLLGILTNLLRYFLVHPAEFIFLEQYHYSPLAPRDNALGEEDKFLKNLLLQAREKNLVKNAPLQCLEALALGPIVALIKAHINRGVPVDETVIRPTIAACWDGLKR